MSHYVPFFVPCPVGMGACTSLLSHSEHCLSLQFSASLKEGVYACLQAGANPNAKDREGHTPLIIAALSDHQELLRLLLPKTE